MNRHCKRCGNRFSPISDSDRLCGDCVRAYCAWRRAEEWREYGIDRRKRQRRKHPWRKCERRRHERREEAEHDSM